MTRTLRTLLRRWPLAVEAVVFLAYASLAKRLLPAGRMTRLLGDPVPATPPDPGPPWPEAFLVGNAVGRVARHLPWKPTCLPQAMATRAMLRRRGIACVSHLGVVRTEPFEAHAWITVNDRVVQGGPIGHATEVARFT